MDNKKYCSHCGHLCKNESSVCPYCSNPLRNPDENDMVFLVTIEADSFEFLQEDLRKNNIHFEVKDHSLPPDGSIYSGKAMIPNKDVYVAFRDFERADQVLAKTFESVEEMNQMPQGKRITVQILSILAFIGAIWLVIYGADSLVNLIKSLFNG